MAINVSGKVWELDLPPVDKLVLLALTDHADSDGKNIRPGNALLCAKTGLSERTITSKIASFIQQGILEPAHDETGRGHIREFEVHLDGIPRHRHFIAKDREKVERRSTFHRRQKVEADARKVESDDVKVEADARKVESDGNALIGIEPSRTVKESSKNQSERKAARQPDPFYESFREKYEAIYECPYRSKKGDFVQLSDCRKQGGEWLTLPRWSKAVEHYFSSDLGNHTLADLASRFGAFYRAPLDRYGKPLNQNGASNGRVYGSSADTRTISDFGIRDAQRVI